MRPPSAFATHSIPRDMKWLDRVLLGSPFNASDCGEMTVVGLDFFMLWEALGWVFSVKMVVYVLNA